MRDPVCGMAVDPHTTPNRYKHAGRHYYFCSAGCQAKFQADPVKYLAPSAMTASPAVPGRQTMRPPPRSTSSPPIRRKEAIDGASRRLDVALRGDG